MKPIILTNAFKRPRGTFDKGIVAVCKKTYVYACIEEIIEVITDNMAAMPLITPAIPDREALAHIVKGVHGIILPGGFSNIAKSMYDDHKNDAFKFPDYDINHDETDIILVKEAIKQKIPILGICRGMQAMNVALGGTLKPLDNNNILNINHDLSCSVEGKSTSPEFMHDIIIKPNTVLSSILQGKSKSVVNSLHEQGIDKLGDGLSIDAVSNDGVIEAISFKEHKFFLGVQWHPEAQKHTDLSINIFKEFISKCNY